MSGIPLTTIDWYYIAFSIEGFLFGKFICPQLPVVLSSPINTHRTDSGVYSAIFIIYLQYKTKNGAMNQSTNSLLYYCFCTLYVLCGFVFVLDLVNNTLQVSKNFIRNNNFFSCY